MKKLLITIIAILSAAALSSCMAPGGMGPSTNVEPYVTANEANEMTAEKAQGVYALEAMDSLGATDKGVYTENNITLNKDGSFIFRVATEKTPVTETSGSYTVAPNGVVSLVTADGTGFFIVAEGETVVCNGEKLTAEGTLGRYSITFNYGKATDNSQN